MTDSSETPFPLIPTDTSTTEIVPALTREGYKIDPAKKVAIVGFASSSRNLAPFEDASFEIWGLNSLYAFLPRWDRWWEIHPRDHIQKDLNRAELKQIGVEHVTWLKEQPGPGAGFRPIYMQDHYPDIPASVRWPRQEINQWTTAMFGPAAELDYFTSTPGEMMAHAIYEGFGEIHLYGIDLLQDEEYAYQRPGCEYWIGVARGLGIKVVVPTSSSLCKATYVYGYSEPPTPAGGVQPLVDFYEYQKTKIEQEQIRVAAIVNTIQGGRQAFSVVRNLISAGKTVEDVGKLVEVNLTQLEAQFNEGQTALIRMSAQVEFAASSVSWVGAFGRGDQLEGMVVQK